MTLPDLKKQTSFVYLALFLCFSLSAACQKVSKPNFVLINIDDLGYSEIEPYGSKENLTPYLSRLAEEGTMFTSFYSA